MEDKIVTLSSFTALRNKIVFIHHVKGSKMMTQVMDVVRRLHGELSEFFDNRVDIVITNQSDANIPRRSDVSYPEAYSPASSRGTSYDYNRSSPLGTLFAPSSSATQTSSLSQPSPLNSNSPYSSQSSPFAALSPSAGSGSGSQKYPSKSHSVPTSTLSRGQRMTMLARNSGSVDSILEKALRRKIGILTVKEFWRWFHSLPNEIQVYCEECLPQTIIEDKKLDQNIGVKAIRPPCIKVITFSHTERPFYVEATHFEPRLWPAEDFVPITGGSPSENSDPAARETPTKKPSGGKNAGLIAQKRWKHRITKANKKKKNGKINICEACHGSYNNLNKHLKSDRHSDFTAKADEHFSSVDQVISSLPTLAAAIVSAKERRNFQNQRRARNRSSSVESRKSTEKMPDSNGTKKETDHINHDVLSISIEKTKDDIVPDTVQSNVPSIPKTIKKDTDNEQVFMDCAENCEIKNSPNFVRESFSNVSQCDGLHMNNHKTVVQERVSENFENDEDIRSHPQHLDNKNSLPFEKNTFKKSPNKDGCMNNFVHEVDLDLSPINDCELCHEPSLQHVTSQIRPDESRSTLRRNSSIMDSFNPSWDNLFYRNHESDFHSSMYGFSRSDTQTFELSSAQLSLELLKSDLSSKTPANKVGPFVNNTPYSPASFKENEFPNIMESTPAEITAPKMDSPLLSAIPSSSRDGIVNGIANKVIQSFLSPVASKNSQHAEEFDHPSLKESNNDDSAFLGSPFAVSRPPVRGRFYGATSSPRRRHSTRLFVRMGGCVSPGDTRREGTPEMECRFAFCSNCDAYHLKGGSSTSIDPVAGAKNSEACLSSSPVVHSPRPRVRGRLFRSPRYRLKLDEDVENTCPSALAITSPEKRTCAPPEESYSTSPSYNRKRSRLCTESGAGVKTTLLRQLSDQFSSDIESPNKDIAKSVNPTAEHNKSPSRRRRRTKK